MTEEQLLNTKGLQAVAVEVSFVDARIMDITGRCIEAGMHVHLDKPGGESLSALSGSLLPAAVGTIRRATDRIGSDHSRRNRKSLFPPARIARSGMFAEGLRI